MSGIDISTVMKPGGGDNGKGDHPCFLCGKETDGSRSVHLDTGGFLVPVTTELDEQHDQGWFDIGPECAKKLPPEYVEA